MIELLVHIKRKYDKLIKDYKFSCMAYAWRKKNRHNKTFAARFFPIDRVTVGKHSYGMLDIRTFCNDAGEKLEIGNYVSIADDVVFILGGQHQTKALSTFPLRSYFTRIDNNRDSMSKGPIIVEDEVWIGVGALILSGVKIGKGAIIGARAVVTKDIPPYSIAAGNPAKIIKYRFSENTIKKILEIKLSDIPEETIKNNFVLLYEQIENNDSIIGQITTLSSLKRKLLDGIIKKQK
jgi:virginiamycin A acetyltransferase